MSLQKKLSTLNKAMMVFSDVRIIQIGRFRKAVKKQLQRNGAESLTSYFQRLYGRGFACKKLNRLFETYFAGIQG